MSVPVEASTAWIYQGIWRFLVDWFKVPEDPPELPLGPAERVERLKLSPGWLAYTKLKFWVLLLIVDIALTIGWLMLIWFLPWLGLLITPLALAVIILPDIVAYVAIHLRYDSTWYVLGDEAMRLRRGIWSLRETTISYNNIQNVRILQGPLERHYGIANIIVETAGGGGGGAGKESALLSMHIGILEGVEDAAGIRDRILKRVQQCRGAGLGSDEDRDPGPDAEDSWSPKALELLEEIAVSAKIASLAVRGGRGS